MQTDLTDSPTTLYGMLAVFIDKRSTLTQPQTKTPKEGQVMQELVVWRGNQEVVALLLDQTSFRIGRAPTNDLTIPEPTLSRQQCEIIEHKHGYRLLDKSNKGTLVNGKRVVQADLGKDARIELGSLVLTLRESITQSAADVTAPKGRTDLLTPDTTQKHSLVLTGNVGDKRIERQIGELTSIGSDPTNDIVVTDSYVSGFHCRIYKKEDHWLIADLDSTNGTRVNGVLIHEARLEEGATISLGQATFDVSTRQSAATTSEQNFCGIVSKDPIMQAVFESIERAAPCDETVLITGESGTGKELVAKALHRLSQRNAKPLINVNCSAITKDLIESELFGHEKGAFTGAQTKRKGLFEEANGGTLFLDEIGELDLELQAKLLRVLENGEIRAVGSNTTRTVNTRVIAATHRYLPEQVQRGVFREDLYYRINVIEINLPPLRNRPKDIPYLAHYFLRQQNKSTQKKSFSKAALAHLASYRYPGNIRELRNTVTRAVLMCPRSTLEPTDLTFTPATLADKVSEYVAYRPGMTMQEVEIEILRQALETHDYNRQIVSQVLGIARSTLNDRIERYQLQIKKVKKTKKIKK